MFYIESTNGIIVLWFFFLFFSYMKLHTSRKTKMASDICDFFNGRSVFITGATGFMGKVLVEKLLRSCPNVKNLFLLLRPKKGDDIHTRLEEIINTKVNALLCSISTT